MAAVCRHLVVTVALCLGTSVAVRAQTTNLDELQKRIEQGKAEQARKDAMASKAAADKTAQGKAADGRTAPLVVSTDSPCTLYVNGQQHTSGLGTGVTNLKIPAGQSLVDCVSTEEAEVRFRTTVTAKAGESVVLEIELAQKVADVRRQRDEALAAGRQRQAEVEAAASRFEAAPDGSLRDRQTTLLWQQRDNGSDVNLPEASEYCTELGEGWRLPSADELRGIYVASAASTVPCGSWTCQVSPGLGLTSRWFWTSELIDTSRAWLVDLYLGGRSSIDMDYRVGNRALCVRSPRAP